jgi:hypothetical protein
VIKELRGRKKEEKCNPPGWGMEEDITSHPVTEDMLLSHLNSVFLPMLADLFAISYLWNYSEPQNKIQCAFRHGREGYWEKNSTSQLLPLYDTQHCENCTFCTYCCNIFSLVKQKL